MKMGEVFCALNTWYQSLTMLEKRGLLNTSIQRKVKKPWYHFCCNKKFDLACNYGRNYLLAASIFVHCYDFIINSVSGDEISSNEKPKLRSDYKIPRKSQVFSKIYLLAAAKLYCLIRLIIVD